MTAKIPSLFDKCVLWWPGEHVAQAATTKTVSPAGDVKQILPWRGAGVGVFDGTSPYDYLDVTDWYSSGASNIGSSSFTIEGWFYLAALPSAIKVLIGNYSATNASNEQIVYITASNTLQWYAFQSGAYLWTISSPTLSIGWTHFACVRNGSSQELYVNGIKVGTAGTSSGSVNNHTSALKIGTWYGNQAFNGYMSEIRWSSIARYTGPFSPPRYQHIPDANTKLLLHFTPTGTTFTDSSPSPKTITRYGDAKCITSPVENGGVAYFDGSGDYLIIPDSDDWFFGTNDFTIEFWYCPLALRTTDAGSLFEIRTTEYISPLTIFHDYSGNNNTYGVMFSWDWTVSRAMKSTTSAAVGRWDHFALVRQGSTFKLFLNGVVESTYTSSNSIGNSGDPLYIGGVPFRAAVTSVNGLLCNYRISKYIARYTSNFTPSTQPFKPDSYTKLLLHFWNRDSPTVFLDSSGPVDYDEFPILPAGVTVTNAGTFVRDLLPNGKSVVKFDGSSTFIQLSSNALFALGGNDYTIHFWVRRNAYDTQHECFTVFADGTSTGDYWSWSIYQNKLSFWDGSTTPYQSTTLFKQGVWYFCSIVRLANVVSVYINGVLDGSTFTDATSLLQAGFRIGKSMNGNMKDILVVNGKAMSPAEIKELMDRSHPITGEGLLPGPEDYWRLS